MKSLLRHWAATATLLFGVLFLTGCSLISLDDFTLHNARIVGLDFTKGATVEMTIENTSLFKVNITGGELTAYHRGRPIGELYLQTPATLPGRSTTTVTVEIGFRFRSASAALSALGALKSSPDDITIGGYGEGRVWFFKKRFERTEVPLSKFIAIFGEVSNYL